MTNVITGQVLSSGFSLYLGIILKAMVLVFAFKIFVIVLKTITQNHSKSKDMTSSVEAMLVIFPEIPDHDCETEFRKKAKLLSTTREIELLAKSIVARERKIEETIQ